MTLDTYSDIAQQTDAHTVLLVLDGLGGLPDAEHTETELEFAQTPNLDALAAEGICGLHEPVASGVTPGSGPGHLALFGYTPRSTSLGVACSVRSAWDSSCARAMLRRAATSARSTTRAWSPTVARVGSAPRGTPSSARFSARSSYREPKVFVQPVKEHRFLLVLRGSDLGSDVGDTDPHETERSPGPGTGDDESQKTADLLRNSSRRQSDRLLAAESREHGTPARIFERSRLAEHNAKLWCFRSGRRRLPNVQGRLAPARDDRLRLGGLDGEQDRACSRALGRSQLLLRPREEDRLARRGRGLRREGEDHRGS